MAALVQEMPIVLLCYAVDMIFQRLHHRSRTRGGIP